MATNINPTEVNLSNIPDIDGILWGWVWGTRNNPGGLNLTFSFPAALAGEYTGIGTAGTDSYVQVDNFAAFNAAQQTAVRAALANIASFCNLTFTEVNTAGATLRYADATAINYTNNNTVATNINLHNLPTAEANPPELAFGATAPFSAPYAQGDGWFNGYLNPALGSFQNAAGIMHETGHNLGLKHGHVTQLGHGVNFPTLPANHDSYEYSVMTYRQFPGDTRPLTDVAPHHPTTYMQDDIAALQYLYGANYGATANNTNTTYTWSTTSGAESINGAVQAAPFQNYVLMTVWDGGGIDTYDFANYTTNLSVDLNPGQWIILDTSAAQFQRANLSEDAAFGGTYFARGNIANALVDPNNPTETTSFIENAIGGIGNDNFLGNIINNEFTGGGGDDTMDGGLGTNTAVYSGPWLNYTITQLGPTTFQVVDNRPGSPDGTDTDTNMQFFRFSDRTFSAAQVVEQPPVITSGGGGNSAIYVVQGSTTAKLTQIVATDPNPGELVAYSISGAAGFRIDAQTGTLTFNSTFKSLLPGSSSLKVIATDQHGAVDVQNITVKVTFGSTMFGLTDKTEVLVFHPSSKNTVFGFDENHDFLQFDKGTFAADTAAAVLAATQDTAAGASISNGHGLQVTLTGVTLADLAAHPGDILFV